MSIWTDLLFLHGHIATPTALALVLPIHPPAAPATPAATAPPTGVRYPPHPLRETGQLR